MYYSLFGRCCPSRPGTCNCSPRPRNQQNKFGQCTPPQKRCLQPRQNVCCRDNLVIKSAAFGGFVLPEGTEKRATFHVASLNLDTSYASNFIVQLHFSCNIIAQNLNMRLRFQLTKQEKGQCLPVPVSAGILYFRDGESSEANSFTLSVCDCNTTKSTCCTYSTYVEIEELEPGGDGIISNPVLIATIVNND